MLIKNAVVQGPRLVMRVFASSLGRQFLKRISSVSLTRYQLVIKPDDKVSKAKYLNAIRVSERWIEKQAPKTNFVHEAEYV